MRGLASMAIPASAPSVPTRQLPSRPNHHTLPRSSCANQSVTTPDGSVLTRAVVGTPAISGPGSTLTLSRWAPSASVTA